MQPTIAAPRVGGDVTEVRPAGGPVLKAWGWPIRMVGTSVLLETTSGFCGVEMRQNHGNDVLRALHTAGIGGPVVRLNRPEPWLVFLAEADIVVDAATMTGHAATLIQGGQTVPLPPTDTGLGRASWAVAPHPSHRWLPALSAIVWALETSGARVR